MVIKKTRMMSFKYYLMHHQPIEAMHPQPIADPVDVTSFPTTGTNRSRTN